MIQINERYGKYKAYCRNPHLDDPNYKPRKFLKYDPQDAWCDKPFKEALKKLLLEINNK